MVEDDRGMVGKLSENADVATHSFDRFSQSGEQEIAAFFETRNTVLGYAKNLREAGLGKFAGFAEFTQGHFLGDQPSRAGFDFLASSGA
jgi:hypothetical protein